MPATSTLLSGLLALILIAAGGASVARAQHAHINAGARTPEQDSPLYFVNGDLFVTNSGYLLPLQRSTTGPTSNRFRGTITFTALPSTPLNGGPAFGHAAPGAHLVAEITSVTGPEGSLFELFQENENSGAVEPVLNIVVGTPAGDPQQFPLSENEGAPGDDPFGHIHGRLFTTSLPGLHVLNLRLLDTSTQGSGGGPLHPASEPFALYLQAGITIHFVTPDDTGVRVGFGGPSSFNYVLEAADSAGPDARWTPVAGPEAGTGRLAVLRDPHPVQAHRFYRLNGLPK